MQLLWPESGFATPADLAACRALLRTGSRTFFAASLLLPPAVREPASALYAFCRLADDAVDNAVDGEGDRVAALARLRHRLGRVYEGRPLPIPVDRAFADVAACFAIPRALPEALFEGFEWDARGRWYEDLSGVQAYAARVAGTVGAMMAVLMGVRAPEVVSRACDLGIAMQLSNIARDVGEDARMGRLYLPTSWLEEVGIDPEAWLAKPVFSEALGSVVQRLLAAADVLYERAEVGIARLPLACRPGIYASRYLYAGIGRELERRGLDSVSQRAVVPVGRKTWLFGRALLATARPEPFEAAPPVDEARFLIEAIMATPSAALGPAAQCAPWWDLDGRMGWVIELFDRLDRRPRPDARAMGNGGAASHLWPNGGEPDDDATLDGLGHARGGGMGGLVWAGAAQQGPRGPA